MSNSLRLANLLSYLVNPNIVSTAGPEFVYIFEKNYPHNRNHLTHLGTSNFGSSCSFQDFWSSYLFRYNVYCLVHINTGQFMINKGDILRRQFAVETEFCSMARNVGGSLIWDLLHLTIRTPIILRWL